MSPPHPFGNAESGPTGDRAVQVARAARAAGALQEIQFAPQVIGVMNELPTDSQVDAVAGAIARIGREGPDAVLKVMAREVPTEPYLVMVPYGTAAPVVTYRKLAEEDDLGSGWLVTGLLPRETFNAYASDIAFTPVQRVS